MGLRLEDVVDGISSSMTLSIASNSLTLAARFYHVMCSGVVCRRSVQAKKKALDALLLRRQEEKETRSSA